MSKLAVNLRRDGFILSSLVSRDFKLKYRRSLLGVLWSVLNPLLMMIVISAVFSFIFRFQIENYPVYLILGQTIFNFLSISTTSGLNSIIDAAPLLKKVRVNKMLFPVGKVVFELVNFSISLVAVAGVMIFFKIVPSFNLLFLPLLLIYLLLFCTGLSLLLSALAVFFRDLIHLWSVATLAWMYLTPIFYPVESLLPWMFSIMEFNPMYYYVMYFRNIALWHKTPSLLDNLICLGFGLAMFTLGYFVFRKLQKKFILHV